jgi:Flp pilus assembly pilin Flp
MTISEWFDFVRRNWRKEDGQTMAEYGVVLAVITVAALVAFQALGGGISTAISKVTGMLPK